MNAITKGNGSGTEMKPALPGALGRTQAVSALRGAFEGHTGPLLAQARPSWPLVPKHSEAGELWQPPALGPAGATLLTTCWPPRLCPRRISGMNLPVSTFWRESDSLMGANCW